MAWTTRLGLAAAALMLAVAPAGALDLTKKRQNLPDLVLGNEEGNDFVVENKDIELEAGKAYRLRIVAKGRQEYKFYAPEFFRYIWLNQIVIEHKEIHGGGPPDHLEFDDPARSPSSSWRSSPASTGGTRKVWRRRAWPARFR